MRTHSVVVRRRAFDLLGQGMPLLQVSQVLGVSSTSLKEWRAAVGGVIRHRGQESGRYLSREERYEIARLHDGGLGVRGIAARLGRAPSTISRELRRRMPPVAASGKWAARGQGRGYQPEAAHQAALLARARPRATKLSRDPRLLQEVQERLDRFDSPEQIAGRLPLDFPDDETMRISHETIYRAIYVAPRGQLRRQLRAHLRTNRTVRKRRNARQKRHAGSIADPVPIAQRPEEVQARLVPGHYEGDLMVGPTATPGAIGTLVERVSGHLTAFTVAEQNTEVTVAALTAAVNHAGWPMKTLTWDRGKEMAGHKTFTHDTKITVYFADPYSPWQRGSNENTNGLLRQYFPKGLDLGTVTDEQLQAAVDQLNNRPRKRHGFRTPNEVLADILTQNQGVATTA